MLVSKAQRHEQLQRTQTEIAYYRRTHTDCTGEKTTYMLFYESNTKALLLARRHVYINSKQYQRRSKVKGCTYNKYGKASSIKDILKREHMALHQADAIVALCSAGVKNSYIVDVSHLDSNRPFVLSYQSSQEK